MSERRALLGVGTAVVAFVALGLVVFGSTGHDDSHITYWAAHALADLGEIVNYNGDRVEQSSSLAQVVLLAIASKLLGVALPTLGPLSSIAFGVLSIFLAAKLARRAVPEGGALVPTTAAWVAATSPQLVYWAFGGLESTLVAAAAAWVILAMADHLHAPSPRRLGAAAAAMALHLTARPESPMVLGCLLGAAGAYQWLRAPRSATSTLRPVLALIVVFVVETASMVGFRRIYFGSSFPNPVTTKASSLDPVAGLRYLAAHTFPATLWLFVAIIAAAYLVALRLRSPDGPRLETALGCAFATAYLGFIVLIGGDWMMGGRFISHLVPIAAMLLAVAVSRVLARRPRLAVGTLGLVLVSNALGVASLAGGVSSGRPIWTTRSVRSDLDARLGGTPGRFGWFETTNLVHLRDAPVVVAMEEVVSALRAQDPSLRVVVMSTQAGMVPYYLARSSFGDLRFIDPCSLVTRDFLPCLPKEELVDHPACRMLPYDKYFREAARIDRTCGSERPHVVFGLKKRNISAVLENAGYVVVYEQHGPMRPGQDNSLGDDYTFRADEIVAVDRELAARAGIRAKAPWAWDVGYHPRAR